MKMELTISSDLKYLREKTNLTQEDMAKLIGISRAAYNRIEKGRSLPKMETFLKICEILLNEEGQEHRYIFLKVISRFSA